MSVSSLNHSSRCPAKLDTRAVFLFNRSICMNSSHSNIDSANFQYCVSMAHYDYIIVKALSQSQLSASEQKDDGSEKEEVCSVHISPLSQAYDELSKQQRSMAEQPLQSILVFTDVSNELPREKIEAFWADHSQPVLFMTLVNLNQKASYSTVREHIYALFPSDTLVYYTFDYNDMVIFHKAASFTDYVHAVLKLDFLSCTDGDKARSLISDTITLYSFLEEPASRHNTEEKFHAYLRMGIANTQMMERFKDQLSALPQYGESLEVNYILGRHDIGFYQPNATLDWINSVRRLISDTSEELKKQCSCQPTLPIWYSSSTLSIRIPATRDSALTDLGTLCWSGTQPEEKLHIQMGNLYRNFEKVYKNACKKFDITADSIWLAWLKNGYLQAISFLESDLMYELGLCLVPVYQDFLTYSFELWKELNLHEGSKLLWDRYRTEAEHIFMDLFQNVSIMIDSLHHSARQFIQTPSFRTIAFSIPPKLMAYYTSVSRFLLKALQDDSNTYGLMLSPSFVRNLEVISVAQKKLTGDNQLLSITISEDSFYTLQRTTFYLAHELSHFVGHKNRMRDERCEWMLKACIHNFLQTSLHDFMLALQSKGDGAFWPHLDNKFMWEKLSALTVCIYESIANNPNAKLVEMSDETSDLQNTSGLYMEEVIELVCEVLQWVSFNDVWLEKVYETFCELIKEADFTKIKNVFASAVFGKIEDAQDLSSPAVQYAANQSIKLLHQRTIRDTYFSYIGDRDDYPSIVKLIADQFKESFADLQAIRLLGIKANDYLDIFISNKNSEQNSLNIPELHRIRVLTVLSVVSDELSFIPDGEFKSILQVLCQKNKNETLFNQLIESTYVNGIVSYYVCEYLEKSLNTIEESFSDNATIKDLQGLYSSLDNGSTLEKLMQTIRNCTQKYRGILCS